MSDEVQKIVDSVRTGNNIESEKSFKDAMTAKVGDALEVRRGVAGHRSSRRRGHRFRCAGQSRAL